FAKHDCVPAAAVNGMALILRHKSHTGATIRTCGRPRSGGERFMLTALRNLFSPEKGKPLPADGKLTLADVLEHDLFEQFYQPKIDLKTMRLVGAEALVRARHPTRGVLGPGVFLPGAGEDEMLALTERVIITALKDWEAFAASGLSLKL